MSQATKTKEDRIARMGTDKVGKLVLAFALPSIAVMVVNGAYNVIDSIFLGQGVGEIGLSTITVATPTMTFFIAVAVLIGSGGNALASLKLGAGHRDEATQCLGNTLTLAAILTVFLLAFVHSPAVGLLLDASSATPEVRPYAQAFITVVSYGFFFQVAGMALTNFVRTVGSPNLSFAMLALGLVLCTVLNYLFVLVLGWGVVGSALATICGQAAIFFWVLGYFTLAKSCPIKLTWANLAPEGALLRRMLSLGFAGFVVQAGFAVINFVINYSLVTWASSSPIGAGDALAGIGVTQRIAMFTIMPMIGVAGAIQPLLGFNYGAHNYARVRSVYFHGVAWAVALGTLFWLGIHIWPEQLVGLFGIKDPKIVAFTVNALKVNLFALPIIGFQIISSNYFQATGQPVKSILLALTRQFFFLLPMIVLLPYVLPHLISGVTALDGVYWGAPVADSVSIVVTLAVMVWEMRRIDRLEHGQNAKAVASAAA